MSIVKLRRSPRLILVETGDCLDPRKRIGFAGWTEPRNGPRYPCPYLFHAGIRDRYSDLAFGACPAPATQNPHPSD